MRKVLKISVIAIILSIVFAVNVQVNKVDASSENEELIAKLMRENEDNPESIKYLVTDRFISRIMPETKVEKFKENFSKGEEVKVYKDKTCQEEVKEGYVYSGMYAKYESNGRIFKIAVIGDIESNDKQENNIEGDGILNQIELTRIIRDYVKTEGWEIKEEEEKQSADVTCDKNVDTKDIKAVIKYIVYDGLDVPEVKKVEAPKVEIIEGRKNAKGEYVNSTKIKITQVNKEDETLKTVYKITGSKTEEYKEINGTEEVIELKGRGAYKVTAYTYGTLENKSKGANEIIQMTEEYTVTFYDEDGVTVLGTSTVDYGTNASYTGAEPTKAATGEYTYAFAGWDAPEKLNNVTENRSVKATYSKTAITYNITYDLNGGELEGGKTNPSTYTVESENITLNNPVKPGYTFIGWTGSNGDVAQTLVTIVKGSTGNKEYVANFKANEATYKVEHYKEGLDGTYVKDEEATQNIGSTVNAEVTAIAKTFKGFTYDENNANNVKTGTVPVEGELVLKLYYKRNSYTLTLNKNENIKEVALDTDNKGESVYGIYKYGQIVNISATLKEQKGYSYTWNKWEVKGITLEGAEQNQNIIMPAENVTLTANANKTLLTYNITYNLNEGTNNSQNPNTYTVEDTITLKEATKTGYTFAGWYEKADFSGTKTVGIANRTGNITLYAKWIKNEYKVIVHHYEEGTKTKVAEDEVIKGDLGASYQTKNLIPTLDEEGNITETDGREYLNPKKYTYASVVGNESGVFTEKDIEVTYYYRVNTFEITGEAKSGGSISNVDETVRYGEDSKNTITITPDTGNRVKEITINGEKLTSYTEDRKTKVVTLETIKNVTENKHIIVTFEPIPMVAKIIEAPEGYESLIGTEYEYLSEAIEKVKTGQETNFVIQIINDIDNETNIIIDRKITIDLNSHTINANDEENATIVVRTGELKVIDSKATGKISNSKGMAIKIEEGGALNLGVDDGSIRYNSPIIEGKTTGVYNLGIFNFYDGVIRGKTAIDGGVTDTPKLYDPKVEQSGEMQESVLAKVTDVEATIGKTRYATLEQAVDAANNIKGTSEDEIEIDIVVDLAKNAKVVMDNTKNIVLDLNGYTLTNTVADYVIENQGKLKIIDSSKTEETEGTGIIKSTTSNTLLNSGTGELTIKGGTITTDVASKNIIDTKETSKVVIEDGAIVSSTVKGCNGIYMYENSQVVVNGGTILGYESGIYNYGTGKIIVNGGKVTATDSRAIRNVKTGTVIVNNGVITGRSYGIYNDSNGNVTMLGGEVNGVYNSSGTVIIENGSITKDLTNRSGSVTINGGNVQNGVSNRIGTITITDGTITGNQYGITNTSSGQILITGGTVTGNQYGITNTSSGQILITGGTVTGNQYGISNTSEDGSITIGKKDGNVIDNIEITAENGIGIYNQYSGTIQYYDGVIKGKSATNNGAILGAIADIEDEYNIKINIENEVEIARLQKNDYVAQVGEEKFTNLIGAVNACTDGKNSEIIILDNFVISESEKVVIEENKNIVLNLNGKQITSYCESSMIENKGSLTITDETESKTGKIISKGKEIIANAGDYKLESGTMEVIKGNQGKYINIIQNTGELSINGGTITSTNAYINAISNEEKGTITINGGTLILTNTLLSGTNRGINTNSTGTIEINGGTISSYYRNRE